MKDDKEHIDQLFESLNDRQFDIPEAFLEDLNKRLDNQPKKRRYGFLWFLVPFALIGAIGIGYFSYPDNSEEKYPGRKEKKQVAIDEYNKNLKNQNTYHLNEPDQRIHHASDSDLSQEKTGYAQAGTPESIQQSAKLAHSVQWGQTKLKTENTQVKQSAQIKTAGRKSRSEISTDKHTKGTSQKQLTYKTKKITDSDKKTSSSADMSVPDKTKEPNLPGSDKGTAPGDKTLQVSIADSDKTSASTKADREELSGESVPEKDSTLAQTISDSAQQVNSNQHEKDETGVKPPLNNWKKEVQFFAGLGGNGIQDSPKSSDYLAKIKQDQHSIFAASFGVNVNFSHKKFTFGSGVNYAQTGEKFKADMKSTELKDSTYSEFIQDTLWVQDSIGNWIPVPHDTTIYHTVQYMDSVSNSQSFQNRYSWISIPLHFGYRFELGDYELIPRLGAVFNFGITSGVGTYPNASFNNTGRYKPVTVNVSYLIELEARRNFDKWFIYINPYFRSMINPAVSGDVIRRRYASWGMQFGIGLKL